MIKFAIIGTSSISEKFINALKSTEGCEAYALLSRDESKGKRFAEKFEIEKLYRNKLQAADQDVLNLYYCNEGYKILPPKYNWPTKYSKTISCDPAIIHYLGKNKPWFVHPNIPEKQNLQITIYKNIFWHYAKMTEFYETLIEQTQYKSLGDLLLFRVHSLINNKHNEQSSEIKFKIKNSQ